MAHLHVDIETYSSVDIRSAGAYKYAESEDFEILMVAYAFGNEPIECYDWKELPKRFFDLFSDPEVLKVAHNATFERVCFRAVGINIPIEQWRCTAIKASYCGLPMSLDQVSKALELGEKGKLSTGKSLIRYFCMPCKATKTNGGRTRNLAHHNPEKWQQFQDYCVNDVEAEREIVKQLRKYNFPASEWAAYALDQQINDTGVLLDLDLAEAAIRVDQENSEQLMARMKEITHLDNPNSLAQLKQWLLVKTGQEITSLTKDSVKQLIDQTEDEAVKEVLLIRQKTGRTSIKKYAAMQNCVGSDGRARGLFQFYGAGRTGRWAGRLIQLQNLPRNYMTDLTEARTLLKMNDPEAFAMVYNVSDSLSQLIRTALIPSERKRFAVADFSAIEARVLAWLAGEKWRLDVFKTHGKIYEASASKMFNVPIEQIGKGSELRSKGKVAELALGYQGSVGALKQMGGEEMGLSEKDMQVVVDKWREANKSIVQFWYNLNDLAIRAVKTRRTQVHSSGIEMSADDRTLRIKLPSGRELIYWSPKLSQNRFGRESVSYKGVDGTTKQWIHIDTYGGKLTENIVQAVARDLLLNSMHELKAHGFKTVMHVHDEAVIEVQAGMAEELLRNIEKVMCRLPDWAEDFPLDADGYVCDFYMKD